MIGESLSLFDTVTKEASTSYKRLMIDLKTMKHSYLKLEIDTITFVYSANTSPFVKTEIKKDNLFDHSIDKLVIRTNTEDGSSCKKKKSKW